MSYGYGVSLLITHYNRSGSLERLLKTFVSLCISFEEIVVSDDGSKQSHLEKVKELMVQYKFILIRNTVNRGLGHNLNKGQDAVRTPLTLYVQEDFLPTNYFKKAYEDALHLMNENSQLDMIRFFSNFKPPYTTPHKGKFSKMQSPILGTDYRKVYMYSDSPHLRRSNFLQKFGRYREGFEGDRTEYWMCISFIQKRGQALLYDEYKSLFQHVNTEEEPSQMIRPRWNPNPNIFLVTAKIFYRQVKYNFDILFRLKSRGE